MGVFSRSAHGRGGAQATIEILERPGTYERLFAIGDRVRKELRRLFDGAGLQVQVAGDGPLFQPFLTEEPITNHRATMTADATTMREIAINVADRGIYTTGKKGYLSLVHSDEDVSAVLRAWEQSLQQRSP